MFRSLLSCLTVLACWSAATASAAEPSDQQKESRVKYAIALHGGAGSWAEQLEGGQRQGVERSLEEALKIGKRILEEGGTSMDAVEQVIRHLEDDPHFNAGRGAVYNSAGGHELDASIMDGRTKACGAVGGVQTVKNPISLARLVMTRTRHVLLVCDGAEKFADQMTVERVEPSYFDTDRQYQSFLRARRQRAQQDGPPASPKADKETVGCVALDQHGNLAAGTSTGGITHKQYGRIGDSPIIGAGTYADNSSCAVSCTGIGEEFIRNAVAFDVSARMKYQQKSMKQAAEEIIHDVLRSGDGGLIAVDKDGAIVMIFNTPGMARAAADSSGRFEVKLGR